MKITRTELTYLIIAIVFVFIDLYIVIFLIIRPYKQATAKTPAITKVLVVKHCKKEILSKKNGIETYVERCQIINKNESISRAGGSK